MLFIETAWAMTECGRGDDEFGRNCGGVTGSGDKTIDELCPP